MAIVRVRAPTTAVNEEDIDQFYINLQRTVDNTARPGVLILMVNLKAKTGMDVRA
jgi:hypothetical protein